MLVQVCLVPFLFARWIDRQVCMFPARSVVIVTALGEATCERAKLAIGVAGEVGECARARGNGRERGRQGWTWGKFNLVAPGSKEGKSKPLN
jgi:hypothetical protein